MSDLIDSDVFRRAQSGSPEDMRNMLHPDLKAIRVAVVKALGTAIHAALKPLGYERKGNDWRKGSMFGRSILEIQRSQYGFALYINVGMLPRWPRQIPLFIPGLRYDFDLKRPFLFCPELPQRDYELDQLHYVKFHESAAFKDAVLTIVRARLIPWVEARHTASSLLSLPSPQDMAQAPLFQTQLAAGTTT